MNGPWTEHTGPVLDFEALDMSPIIRTAVLEGMNVSMEVSIPETVEKIRVAWGGVTMRCGGDLRLKSYSNVKGRLTGTFNHS